MARKFTYYNSVIPIDPDAQAIFDEADALGSPFTSPYKARINNFVTYAKVAGVWADLDWLTVEAMIDSDVAEADRKVQVNINMVNPAQSASFHNDYAGSHVAGRGYVGNSTDFGVLTEFNPSTASNYTQNSATYGWLCLSDTAKLNCWSISCIDAGFTKYCQIVPEHYTEGYQILNEATTIGNFTYQVPRANNHQWRRSHRTASNLTHELDNGMLVAINIETSGVPPNSRVGRFGIYSGSWYVGAAGYSPSKQGAYYAGSGSLDANTLETLIGTYLLAPIGNDVYMNKSILALGDSIFSSQSQGMFSRMYQTTISGINNHWTLTNLAASGKWASDYDTAFNTKIAPFYRSDWNKEVLYFAAGTNDMSGAATAAQVYTSITSVCNKAGTAGWDNIVISGVMDRSAGLGVSQAAFDAERDALRALFLADFNVAHPTIPNYYTSNLVTYASGYVDVLADAIFADSTDLTYFSDGIHLTNAGNDYYSTEYCQPILQTF